VNNKQIFKDLLEKLPEEASLLEIAQEVEFLDGVRVGLEQADRGEFVSADELRDQVRLWVHSK
jgi:predicted transcriptional regulator